MNDIMSTGENPRFGARWALLFATAVWFIAVVRSALTAPRELAVIGDATNDLSHLVVFALLASVLFTVLGDRERPVYTGVLVMAIAVALGVGIELGQLATSDRTAEVSDVAFDLIGAWLGLATTKLSERVVGPAVLRGLLAALLVLSLAAAGLASSAEMEVESSQTALPCPLRPLAPGTTSTGVVEPLLDYPLDEQGGASIHEASGGVELVIEDPQTVEWSEDGLTVSSESAGIASLEAPRRLIEAVEASDELSVEVWVRVPELPQTGPARIVTLSDGTGTEDVDFHLGVEDRGLSFRVRTDCDWLNWRTVDDVLREKTWHHVVATYRPGEVTIHVNGVVVGRTRVRVGLLDGWSDEMKLRLGNEASLDRPFVGTIGAVAVFDRALDATTIAARFEDGPH